MNQFIGQMPDAREWKQCAGKRMMNKERARQTVAWMRKHADASDTLRMYRCAVCRHWHIGNETPRRDNG